MAKKVTGIIKLQIPAGQANPAPPVGPALGQQGVNIMGFCKEFNARTKDQAGMIIPVVITVFQDKSFTFITKSPPAAVLLKKAAGIAAGSKIPNKDKVGKVTRDQVNEIVKSISELIYNKENYNIFQKNIDNVYNLETNVIEIEGSYTDMVRLIYEIEFIKNISKVTATYFIKQKDISTKKTRLTATIYLQNINIK